jgi:hypothetical protein
MDGMERSKDEYVEYSSTFTLINFILLKKDTSYAPATLYLELRRVI